MSKADREVVIVAISPESGVGPVPPSDAQIIRWGVAIVAISVTSLLFLHSARAALSALVGGVLSWVNFLWMKRGIQHALNKGDPKQAAGSAARFVGRYALIGVCLYVTIRFLALSPAFLLLGLFAFVLAILLVAILESTKHLVPKNRNGRT